MSAAGSRRDAYLQALGIDRWVPRAHGGGAPAAAAAPPAPSPAVPPAPLAAAAPVPRAAAGPACDLAARWEALRTQVATCTRCALHQTRTQGVFGVGPERVDWLVIGEAPGAEEDRRGEPFVGAAGQLLDAMLRAIGLDRKSNVYIANVLKSRPPGNRDPKPEEVAACLPYLQAQIELLRPKLMLAVGRIAAQSLLGTDAPLGRLRGEVHRFGDTPLVVTYHPAYLLRTPAEKRKAWEDLKFARSVYQQLIQGRALDGHRT
ncbi:MAG TPA: uracil-DNA glycosylase [Steroidobacteraceae bacterium]|nr:uracil-DNA glycosylase [Steroidobacteraceae bacterium]